MRRKRIMFAAALVGIAIVSLVVLLVSLQWEDPDLPDFSRYDAGPERKAAFFEYLRPVVDSANTAVADDRERLESIIGKGKAGYFDRRWLVRTAEAYRLDVDASDPKAITPALMARLDTVPVSMVLAQAAMESAWGTSRFAREGNNLFGEWCFIEGCGIVPSRRSPGKTHEVEVFETPLASVESYLHNLNTHNAYRELRGLRASLRQAGEPVTGYALAAGLLRYSEKGQAYVDEIRLVIRGNDLE